MLKLIISFQEHLKLCFSIMWEPRWKFLTKSNKGGKKSLIIHSRISTQIELLVWPCIDKREWSVLLTCESYESPQITCCVKKCCLTWIYQTWDCQLLVTKKLILDGYYDTSEGRYSKKKFTFMHFYRCFTGIYFLFYKYRFVVSIINFFHCSFTLNS